MRNIIRDIRPSRFALFCAAIAVIPVAALAFGVDSRTTAAIAMPGAGLTPSDSVTPLKSGLDALTARDIGKARDVRDGLPEASLDRQILIWAIAMRGGLPSGDIATANKALPGWPGAGILRRNSERALYNEKPDPQTVLRAFGTTKPQTVEGVIVLARAHLALGDAKAALAVLSPFWRTEKLDASDEAAIIREFGSLIPAADHRARMERMLYSERINSAQRVAELADAKALADAWGASIRGEKSAATLMEAVPQSQRSPGYLFAKAKMLRKQGKFAQAGSIVLKAPRDRASLVDPDAWWIERRVLARELVDLGDMKTAYDIAAGHSAESPVNVADAEFHAGWFALRGLNDANTGAKHFARIAEIAEGPLSLSRAYYWLGRAAEADGPGSPDANYRKAAAYGTTFYGQLAAERIGSDALEMTWPGANAHDRHLFARREPVKAIKRLQQAGYPTLAETLYRGLAAELTNPAELALLAAMAEHRDNHFLALKIGKIAASRGIDIGALSHPVGVIPSSANISGAGEALAYAIARQESEFNVGAVSGAGARGLLQLLPGTAKEVAQKAGMTYSRDRLTTDAGYNATLGAAFLGEQLRRFDGSYVLTFAGYNAGPGRAREWVRRYGDPRGKDIDAVVDWIERIPFTETRGYVQRVMENYQVYKMRLSGKFDIESDLVDGRS